MDNKKENAIRILYSRINDLKEFVNSAKSNMFSIRYKYGFIKGYAYALLKMDLIDFNEWISFCDKLEEARTCNKKTEKETLYEKSKKRICKKSAKRKNCDV